MASSRSLAGRAEIGALELISDRLARLFHECRCSRKHPQCEHLSCRVEDDEAPNRASL